MPAVGPEQVIQVDAARTSNLVSPILDKPYIQAVCDVLSSVGRTCIVSGGKVDRAALLWWREDLSAQNAG